MDKINYFIREYLKNRPFFHVFIRPQEAALFSINDEYISRPVLDFGCGDGFFARLVFGKKKIDVGLDVQNSRAKTAEKEKIYKDVVYYEGSIIPYPDNYFQSVISNCVLEHIPNIAGSLKEIHRVLKPGGYFLATVMTNKWEDYLYGKNIFGRLYVQMMRKIQVHYNLISEKNWLSLFKKNGFMVVNKTGYLSRRSSNYNEIFHFLSLPSLISYKLFGKWVLGSALFSQTLIVNKIRQLIGKTVDTDQSAAIFIVLRRSK